MKKKSLISVVLSFLLVLGVASVAHAEMEIADWDYQGNEYKLFTEIHAVGGLQGLSQDNNDGTLPDLGSTFHTAFANMDWRVELDDYAELYFDVTQASRVYSDRWWGHEGYMRIERLPEGYPLSSALNPLMNNIDVKIGHFDVNYGWYGQTSSINADVQRNPLVGNHIVRPLATEAGIEVIGDQLPVKWLVGFNQGNSTEEASDDAGFSSHAKVWGNVAPGVELAGSFYTLDSSDVSPHYGSGPGHLYVTERMGGRYASVFGGGAAANVLPGNGMDETAYQLDLRMNPTDSLSVNLLYGTHEEGDADGAATDLAPEQNWNHYGATIKQDLTDHIFLAGRYSAAEVDKYEEVTDQTSGTGNYTCTNWGATGSCTNTEEETEVTGHSIASSSSGTVERIQLGAGVQIFKGFLAKVEYVKEEASDFDQDAALGVDATKDPEFDGVIAEFSMTY